MGIPIPPRETDAELLVDTNAPLPFSISGQHFEVIPWGHFQVSQFRGVIQNHQLSQGNPAQVRGRHPPVLTSLPELLSAPICEAPDHQELNDNVNRY